MSAKYGPLFEECAAPVAIAACLEVERAARARLDRTIAKLEALQARRAEQIAAGTWPPKPARESQ